MAWEAFSLTVCLCAAQLRLCFVHMTTDWPCFGAISISFVGKPEIDFTLKAAKLDIMSIPGLGAWLENFIKDTLVWLMVWPTVMHIPILEGEQCVTGHTLPVMV